ncbi:hypothetical protein C7M84_001713 [Penaeus vannamei]|uniref:Uncharacterized protein n=1 Tax=Penaeus vannamei TaxID=6689 RepID=A0A3R7PWT6_PENVA|nr:hypothetical protein C7M84_001713 [Penaeus vannamei]
MCTGSVKWLMPADREATGFHVAYEHGTRKGVYGVTMNTTKALKEEVVRLALDQLKRRHPPLRSGLRRRDSTVWFYESDDNDVDFKVKWSTGAGKSGEEDPEEVSGEGVQEAANCNLVGGQALIPPRREPPGAVPREPGRASRHQRSGLSEGRDLGPGGQRQAAELEEDPQRYEFVKQSLPSPTSTPLLLQAFPRPTGVTPSTRHVARSVDSHVTGNLQKKCKIHGVTLNSVIAASLNIALMRLLKKAGMSQQSFTIRSSHAVNLGRYLKRTPPSSVGGYGLLLSYASDVDTDAQESFWQYCKRIHQDLKENLRSGLPLEQKMLPRMVDPSASPEEEFQRGIPVVHDFGVTNVGSFPTLEPGPDDNIFITDVAPYNILHQFVHMNLFQVITFRGRCNYTLSYATDFIADETATSFADELMLVLQEVSDISNL